MPGSTGGATLSPELRRPAGTRVGDEESDEFDFTTIFDGLEFSSRATEFREGAWLAYFGGGELDLSAVQLDPAGATLRLRAILGGGKILVPSNCRVEFRSRSIIGGVQDGTGDAPGTLRVPTLVIDAFTLMGGFLVIRGEAARGTQTAAEARVAEVEIGIVDHYFGRIGVVGITLTDRVAVGDTIHIKGHTTDLVHAVESMQIDNASVEEAGPGDSVGIVVEDRCRVGDKVFRVDD